MNIIDAIADPQLFRPFLGELNTWAAWMTALRCLYGLPIDPTEHDLITECTGRDSYSMPADGFSTVLFLTGRRSGKSRTAAITAAFEATLAGRESRLAPGEHGVVLVTSPTKSQSRIVRDYIRAVFTTPLLANEVTAETKEGFELKSGTRIEILAGDWRSVRGFTVICAIVDEAAFFGYDADAKVKSDTELMRALKPSLATSGGKLIAISSPYAMKGWCWNQHKRNFGNHEGRTLVWNCPSRTMNSTLSQVIVDDAVADDPAAAAAEYFGKFRSDVLEFVSRELVESLVIPGRTELSPHPSLTYAGFADVSGGRADDAALAIGHKQGRTVVVDLIRRWKAPHNPLTVIGEMAAMLKRYGIRTCNGDNYSAEFTRSTFKQHGIDYRNASTSEWKTGSSAIVRIPKPKSQLYLELLPRMTSGEIELLDHEATVDQLAALERRTRSGGRDVIDHPPGAHDDLSNVVAGVADACQNKTAVAGVGFPSGDVRPTGHPPRSINELIRGLNRKMGSKPINIWESRGF